MRVRIVLRQRPPRQDRSALFSACASAPRRSFSMCGSMAAHLVFVVLVRVASSHVAAYYSDEMDWSRYTVDVLRLRVPEPVYYAPEPDPSTAHSNRAGADRSHNADAGERARHAMRPAVELPPLPLANSDSSILRTRTTLSLATRSAALPSLAFWARRAPANSVSRPDTVVNPGLSERDTPAAGAGAPPSPEIPNNEADQAAANIERAPQESKFVLHAPPSAATPIRDRLSERRGGVFDFAAGEPANVIVLSPHRGSPSQIVELPPGSRGAPVDSGNGLADGASGQSADVPFDPGSGNKANGRAGNLAEANATRISEAIDAFSNALTQPARMDRPFSGSDRFIRILHPPGGSFDVIMTHAGSRPEIPGVSRPLSGSPVYSAFIPVGDEREWVLAYCLPASPQSSSNRYTVYAEAMVQLTAPFPISTVVRAGCVAPRRSPMTFHGYLTAFGTLRDMQSEESTDAIREVASTLGEWRFKPARRGNTPVEVEMMLILPATTDHKPR